MQVDIHWVAAERAQEETGRSDRQRLASTLQGNAARQSLAISTGISEKTSTAEIASPSSPITAVSSSPVRWR
jgi:hypothetical protein